MVNTDEEIKWHNDGHTVMMLLNKDRLEIVGVQCPNKGKDGSSCEHDDAPCVVEYFLNIYGLECNVGVVDPSAEMTVAWAFIGDRHKDLGACQVWVIPTNDEAFSAWIATQAG
jgi:hypothetical protein